jgi:hypothetical protein
MFQQVLTVVKVLSTILISSVLALELWNLWAEGQLPPSLHLVLVVGHIAVTIHVIEGIIAAFYAPSRGKTPFFFALYTFFVGFPGLFEILGKIKSRESA